jgi:hypothetical protein
MQKSKVNNKKAINLRDKKPTLVFSYLRVVEELKLIFPSLKCTKVSNRRKKNNVDLHVVDL